MKNLVIVESPSKSKTIEKYLGKDYTVVSSKGHIRDLAIKGKDGLGVDVDHDFAPTYQITKDRRDTVKQLKKQVSQADHVYLATDPDREGEAISWHLADELQLDPEAKNRVVFHEITKPALLAAFAQPRTIDMNLVRSQETRRILDRIIGFKLSKLLQQKIKSKSAGRVQSVALHLIVDREKEIRAFVPVEYWSLHARFENPDGVIDTQAEKYAGKKLEMADEASASRMLALCDGPFTLDEIKVSVKKRSPKLAFTTSTLQQEAVTKLGFSAKKTMRTAQRLYEGVEINGTPIGLITYMRTDSTRLSDLFVKAAHDAITQRYGKQYAGVYRKVAKKENIQDAHEGIRPTDLALIPEEIKEYLSNDEYKLYRLIYRRALASLMKPAEIETSRYLFSRNQLVFAGSGSNVRFDGYLNVYDYEKSADKLISGFVQGSSYDAKDLQSKQHFTEPPLRYNEARLVKEMEELGIGRPSTYAMIMDTLVTRNYVTLGPIGESKAKVFVPTEQGELTDSKLQEHFRKIINVDYTASMEHELDEIADGSLNYVSQLRAFMNEFEPLLASAQEHMEKIQPEYLDETCPLDGGQLVIRRGRYGKFVACSNYPKCRYNRSLNPEQKQAPEPTGEMCPECGSPLVRRKNRFGRFFIGCSNYPKCHYIKPSEKKKKQAEEAQEA